MRVDLHLAGPRSDTSMSVSASAQGVAGPVRLTLQLPDGVTLTGANGDWVSCGQDQDVVTCTGEEAVSGRWSGTVHTTWSAHAQGRVRATVAGTYANGSPAAGSVGTTWPP